jgi:hypothetical protein
MEIFFENPLITAGAAVAALMLLAAIAGQLRVAALRSRYRDAPGSTECPECGSTRFRKGRLTSKGYRYTCQGSGCGTIYAFVPGVGIVDKIGERSRRR